MVNHDKINLENSFYLICTYRTRETRCLSGQRHLFLEASGVKELNTQTALTIDSLQPEQS